MLLVAISGNLVCWSGGVYLGTDLPTSTSTKFLRYVRTCSKDGTTTSMFQLFGGIVGAIKLFVKEARSQVPWGEWKSCRSNMIRCKNPPFYGVSP